MSPVAARKIDELEERLLLAFNEEEELSSAMIEEIRGQLLHLRGMSKGDFFELGGIFIQQGLLETLAGDEAAMRSCFSNAMRYRKNDSVVHHNFSISLSLFGHFEEALEQARLAVKLSPGNPIHMENWIVASVLSGKVWEALRAHQALALLVPEQGIALERFQKRVALFEKWGLVEEDVAQLMTLARGVIPFHGGAHKLRWRFLDNGPYSDENICLLIYVPNQTVEGIVEISDALVNALACAEPPLKAADRIVVLFTGSKEMVM